MKRKMIIMYLQSLSVEDYPLGLKSLIKYPEMITEKIGYDRHFTLNPDKMFHPETCHPWI